MSLPPGRPPPPSRPNARVDEGNFRAQFSLFHEAPLFAFICCPTSASVSRAEAMGSAAPASVHEIARLAQMLRDSIFARTKKGMSEERTLRTAFQAIDTDGSGEVSFQDADRPLTQSPTTRQDSTRHGLDPSSSAARTSTKESAAPSSWLIVESVARWRRMSGAIPSSVSMSCCCNDESPTRKSHLPASAARTSEGERILLGC